MAGPTREITINLRARRPQRDLIDRAAATRGQSRTDFMLEAACEKAEQVLLDQSTFRVDARTFRRFVELLDRPPEPDAALSRLLASRSPWDR